jgi:hypothetical protein
MAWSASGAFTQTFVDDWKATIALNLDLETHKVALFGNGVTPNYEAAASATQYGAGGTWTTGNEVTGTNYTAGGTLLLTTTVTNPGSGVVMWDAADTFWSTATISNIYGCLIYADAMTTPVVDQGIMAVYFGAGVPFSVTAGTFTIQWAATGIWRDTIA